MSKPFLFFYEDILVCMFDKYRYDVLLSFLDLYYDLSDDFWPNVFPGVHWQCIIKRRWLDRVCSDIEDKGLSG